MFGSFQSSEAAAVFTVQLHADLHLPSPHRSMQVKQWVRQTLHTSMHSTSGTAEGLRRGLQLGPTPPTDRYYAREQWRRLQMR